RQSVAYVSHQAVRCHDIESTTRHDHAGAPSARVANHGLYRGAFTAEIEVVNRVAKARIDHGGGRFREGSRGQEDDRDAGEDPVQGGGIGQGRDAILEAVSVCELFESSGVSATKNWAQTARERRLDDEATRVASRPINQHG